MPNEDLNFQNHDASHKKSNIVASNFICINEYYVETQGDIGISLSPKMCEKDREISFCAASGKKD